MDSQAANGPQPQAGVICSADGRITINLGTKVITLRIWRA